MSLDEARGLLGQIISLAAARDFNGMCALSDGNCIHQLDLYGKDRVPANPPTLVGYRVIPPASASGGNSSLGGTVLTVCGTDGLGSPYRSEVLVFRDAVGLRAINAVYWGGGGIAEQGDRTSLGPQPQGTCQIELDPSHDRGYICHTKMPPQ